MHYAAVLLIPFYQLFVRLEQQPPQTNALPWRVLLLYALAWLLLCYGNQWTFFDRTMYDGPLWVLVLSYKFYGLLLLWFALAFDPTAMGGRNHIPMKRT
jgi:RsiW-degrading membrane proteinase PrsW (M82 family)